MNEETWNEPDLQAISKDSSFALLPFKNCWYSPLKITLVQKFLDPQEPSFPCARDTWALGIPWLSLIYSFISRRVNKHARQLILGARVSLAKQ